MAYAEWLLILVLPIGVGLAAKRKNRSVWLWLAGTTVGSPLLLYILFRIVRIGEPFLAVLGGCLVGWLGALLFLSFAAHLCPKCRQPIPKEQWRLKECLACGWRSAAPSPQQAEKG